MIRKNLWVLSLALFLVWNINYGTQVSAASIQEEENWENIVNFATDVVQQYYENKDLGETYQLSETVSPETLDLLNYKSELTQIQKDIIEVEYSNYEIDIIPFKESEWTKDQDEFNMTLQVIRSWFYKYADFSVMDEKTTDSELLDIVISQNPEGELTMVKCCNRYEDMTLGPVDEIYQENFNMEDDLDNVLDEYKQSFEEQCVQKKNQMDLDEETVVEENAETQSKTYLSAGNIYVWARNNYNKTTPVSSDSSIKYYDFSQITNAYDCTNFVSHALLAGDASMHDDGKSGITGTDQWYFRNVSNRSSSWAGVNELYLFLTRSSPGNSNIGPYATKKTLSYSNASLGDIVQGHNGSVWRHSTVVTKLVDSKVYVTGRSGAGAYNNNVLATTIYGTQRLLCLGGNYD